MKKRKILIKIILLLLNFLAKYYVNVAFSAVALLYYLAQSFSVVLEQYHYGLLFSGVMIVYNLDFILDHRKNFCLKKWNPRVAIVILFFSINVMGTFYLITIDLAIVLIGLGLVLLIILYFILLHFYRYFFLIKELIVSLLFSFALLGFFLTKNIASNLFAVQFFIIFLLLFHNALIFSIANVSKDIKKNQQSLVIYFSLEKVKKAADGVGFLGVLFTLFNRNYYLEPWLAFYIILIFLLQGILLKNVSKLVEKKVFYLLGNSIFFLAFLIYFFFFYLWQIIV